MEERDLASIWAAMVRLRLWLCEDGWVRLTMLTKTSRWKQRCAADADDNANYRLEPWRGPSGWLTMPGDFVGGAAALKKSRKFAILIEACAVTGCSAG